MPYKIAGIDVHKKMLAVVVADVEGEGDFQFERHKVGTSPAELRALAGWLVERQVDEVVMESTAQYWRPVWEALELHWRPQRRHRDHVEAPQALAPQTDSTHFFKVTGGLQIKNKNNASQDIWDINAKYSSCALQKVFQQVPAGVSALRSRSWAELY